MLAINLLKTGGFLFSAASVLAVPVVVESLNETPAGWEEADSPSPDEFINLSIGLEPEDHKLLERTIYEVSDPDHHKYGKHLSRESAKALLRPSSAATKSVKRWLSEAGVPDHHVRDEGEWLHIRTTVKNAEGMLSTRFSVFARDDRSIVRTREYSVPHEIRRHIASIQPTTLFSSFQHGRSLEETAPTVMKRHVYGEKEPRSTKNGNYGGPGPIDLKKCKTEATPACIRKLYNLPKKYPSAAKGSLYTTVSFQNMTSQRDELQEFLRRYAPDLKGVTFADDFANGGKNTQGDNVPENEGNLNIQYAVSLASRVPVQHLAVGGINTDYISDLDLPPGQGIETWLEFAEHILNLPTKKLPSVISISWGEYEQHLPKKYARQVCNKFGQIGTRGVSIIVPAGNQGVGVACQSNDGKKTKKFLPTWPSACPYVTTVGGTGGNNPEIALSDGEGEPFSTGGGFSDLFPRPEYQEKAMKEYLKKYGKKWQAYYNPKGRAYPDVAAIAAELPVMVRGEVRPATGTSAAAPTFGAIVALLSNERLRKGKPAMGFLNPWIYKKGYKGFTDIVHGRNYGCQGFSLQDTPAPKIPGAGWEAVKGWDPVSGFGTPLYDKLEKLAL
ncbi:hypothetical protein FPSE_09020 [Fusarium pseudograminearum CS3096]|uniref:tripeptidyl-peptidase II n=1 Tax=Fusarium pseudograminearum (strain CS3096) TaxID=1028729 RepID=K3VBA1_FUSPC|nr:hypothetical protein FPSE_09020 [Fusarium pseudograminearum CS3096]EKJ70784.1 hypothetical protein FPSE_09020 [Fusarium pseudograminearum CS3096]KAF0643719.1 hypothetical protein FPSE5266_09020 [Fusarium pseudograminearum]